MIAQEIQYLDDEHKLHIKKGVEMIKKWNSEISVVGLWINDKWAVETV